MYVEVLYKRLRVFLQPVWRFRPSTRLLIVGSSSVLILTILAGATFLDDFLDGIAIRNQLYQETEPGDVAAPEFPDSLVWLDDQKHSLGENDANVTVLHFWSAACVTCLDAYGRLAQWQDYYAQHGAMFYGIYAPQFNFEVTRPEVVNAAIDEHNMTRFPVGVDNDYELNDAFYEATESFSSNGSVIVMIDKDKNLRHVIPDATNLVNGELVLQSLLYEAGVDETFSTPTGTQRSGSSITTNLFFNREDTATKQAFIAKEKLQEDRQTYTISEQVSSGQWSLGGTWDWNEDHLQAISNGSLILQLTGKRAFIVASSDEQGFVGVSVNGKTGAHRPVTVAKDGILDVKQPGIYQVVGAKEVLKNQTLQLTFSDNLKLYQLVILPD